MRRSLALLLATIAVATAFTGRAGASPAGLEQGSSADLPGATEYGGVAYDSNGNAWIAYMGQKLSMATVAQVNPDGATVSTFAVDLPLANSYAVSLAVGPDDNLYLGYTTITSGGMSVYSPAGALIRNLTLGSCRLEWPSFPAVAPDGTVYVPDQSPNNAMLVFDPSGTCTGTWRSPDMSFPVGAALDSSGNVYVSNSGNSKVLQFNAAGTLLTSWSVPIESGYVGDVAVDDYGLVYVANSNASTNSILTYTAQGVAMSSLSTTNPYAIDVWIDEAANEARLLAMPDSTGDGPVTAYDMLFNVSTTLEGSGLGGVASPDGSISCGFPGTTSTCSAAVPLGTLTLEAWTSNGSTFVGWGGQCAGQGSCALPVTYGGADATATFAQVTTPSAVTGVSSSISGPRSRNGARLHLVKWYPPIRNGGADIVHYEVRFKAGETRWTAWTQTKALRAERPCRRAHETCTAEVRAVNIIGAGPERRVMSRH